MSSQGASNGPAQGAGQQFVKFSRQSAQRIAKVVRHVEQGDRIQDGVTFDHPAFGPSVLKVATFTGSWGTGTWKTVTLTNSTQTASVYNWTTPVTVPEGDSCARHVVFGKASGTNSLVEVRLQTTCGTCVMSIGNVDLTSLAGYAAGSVQVLGHNTTGPCLQWYSVTTCATSTAA